MKNKIIVLASTIFLLVGCSNYVPETNEAEIQTDSTIKAQENFSSSDDNDKNDEELEFSNEKWWFYYNDENLNTLIEIALDSNTDLKVATLNIEQANATISAADSSNFKAGAYANATYYGTSQAYTKSKAVPGPMGSTVVPENAFAGETAYTAGIGVRASYTFDLYDKYGSLVKQQEYIAEAAKFHAKLVELSITTNLVKLYGSYIYQHQEKENLEKRLEVLNSIEDKIKVSIKLGQGVPENKLNIEKKILALKTYINSNKLQIKITEETIFALTTYKNKDDVKKILKNSINDNFMGQELIIPNKISSDVIINRPDVKYYLMMIKSEQAKLKSLKSDFYPQISIGGDVGYKGLGIDNSFKDFQSLMWSFGPKVYLPIFNMSGVKTNYKIAGLQVNTFVANYNKTINNAIKDINTKLSSAKFEKLNTINYSNSFKKDEKIFSNSTFKLKIGSISELQNLNDKYDFLDASLHSDQQNYKLFTNQIDLINSLGGVYKSKDQIEGEIDQAETKKANEKRQKSLIETNSKNLEEQSENLKEQLENLKKQKEANDRELDRINKNQKEIR